MKTDIRIVDVGRGLQLSTCRIWVQDLVPYFQDRYSYEEILHWIPVLSLEEIAVVERYYREHQAELDEEDRLIRERIAQRQNPPEIDEKLRRAGEKMAALREEFKKKRDLQERNGAHASC